MDLELNFEKRYRLAREIIETLVLTILMFLIIRLAVQNFNIDGMSMEPNLHNQELIIVDKWSYMFHTPTRGDVIVFVAPPNPSQDYIKRVIGLPGDIISIQDTTVFVNGKPLKEGYIDPRFQGNPYTSFSNRVVPPDAYFVLGDNRGGSSDSRAWGCVPKQNIIGRGALVYWPLGKDNLGLLPNVAPVFSDVPGPASPLPAQSNICPIQHGVPATAPAASVMPGQSQAGNMQMALVLVLPSVVIASQRRKPR